MASSAVVGVLRALLVADTAEFDKAMKRATSSAGQWSQALKTVGRQAEAVGKTLSVGLTLPLAGLAAGASKLAIDFESSFAGVRKTVDATEPELAALSAQFRQLAKEIPISVNEINKLAETAGALGIPKEAIKDFVEVMAGLGVATNLTADDAANSIARIQTIFGAAGKDTDRFASTLVGLGNAGASTEKEIVEMAQRIAGAGHSIGLTQAQVLSLSSAMAGLGIEAEAGGSSMSRVLILMNQAVAAGGKELEKWAAAAKTTGAKFKEAFEQDAAGALTMVVEGLATAGKKQADVVQGLVGDNVRLLDMFQRLAGSGDTLRKTLELGNAEWEKNTALTNETSKRYETTASQLTLLWNRLQDVGITLGQALLPALKSLIDAFSAAVPYLESLVKWFTDLPKGIQFTVIAFGALAAVTGPALMMFGSMATGLGTLTAAFKTGGIAARAFGASMTFLMENPVVLLLAGLAAVGVAIYKVATAETDLQKEIRTNTQGFIDHTNALDKALSTYNALKDKQNLTTQQTKDLNEATRLLAEASGMSVEGFKQEATKSDELNTSLQNQLNLRKDLKELAIEEQRRKVAELGFATLAAEEELRKINAGKGTVFIPGSAETGPGGDVPMSRQDELAAAIRLQAQIKALNEERAKENAILHAMTGVKQEDIILTDASAEAERKAAEAKKKAGEAAVAAAEEETKAEKRRREELEKTGRAISEAGVADKIAEMSAQIAIANKYGGLAKESWKKYTDQIEEWLRAGYNVPPLLKEFRYAHIDLLAAQVKVTDNTKALLATTKNVGPAVRAMGDDIAGVSEKYKQFAKDVQTSGADVTKFLNSLGTGIKDLGTPPPQTFTVWQVAADNLKNAFIGPDGVITQIGAGLAQTLAAGLMHAQSFSDGFVAIWKGIKNAITNILADVLNLFINQFLRGMVGALMGQQGAMAAAYGKILAGLGTGAATGVATGAGTAAGGAAAGAGAAGGTGAGAAAGVGVGTVAGIAGGAGAGAAVGYYVGHKSGSATKGAAAGAATGATVGSFFGPWGTVIGAGVGAAAGWYGAVKAGKQINDIRDAFIASQGSADAIHTRLKDLGHEDLWKPFAEGPRNLDSFKEALGNIQEVFQKADEAAKKLADDQKVWRDSLAGGFEKLGEKLSVFGGQVPAAMRPTIAAMLESTELTKEMRGTLEGMASGPSWQDMQKKAEELGISLSGLGAKFQESKITETALGYARDLHMFADEGANMQTVIEGMADEMSTLYQDAMKSGVALPESLKPYMQALAEQGLLLDENGKKVENLNEVAFKDIEDKGLKDVVSVLEEIAKLLKDGLPQAAKEGAKGIQAELDRNRPTLRVPVTYDDPGYGGPAVPRPGGGDSGTDGTNPPPGPGLQGGTHGQYVDWGSGTLVTLHGRERVMPAGEAVAGGSGGPIQITVVSTLDGREVARNQVRYIPNALRVAGI